MAVDPALYPQVLDTEDRWRRWEQRGRGSDAAFRWELRRMFWYGAVVMTVVVMIFLLS